MRNVEPNTVWIDLDAHGKLRRVTAERPDAVQVYVGNSDALLRSNDALFKRCEVFSYGWLPPDPTERVQAR